MSNLLSTIIPSGYQNISVGKYVLFDFINPDALTRYVRTEKIIKVKPYSICSGSYSIAIGNAAIGHIAGHYNSDNFGGNFIPSSSNYTTILGNNSTSFGYNSIIK